MSTRNWEGKDTVAEPSTPGCWPPQLQSYSDRPHIRPPIPLHFVLCTSRSVSAARPLHNPILLATCSSWPAPPFPVPVFQKDTDMVLAESATQHIPGSGSHRVPPAGVLPHRECVFKNKFENKPIYLAPSKKTLFFPPNCGHAGSAFSGPSCCLILTYYFLINPDEKLWGSRTTWAQRFWRAVS